MRRMNSLQIQTRSIFFVYQVIFLLSLALLLPLVSSKERGFIETVSISGKQIFLNGSPGILKGFTFIGRLNPQKTICTTLIDSCCAFKAQIQAWEHWGEDILKIARDKFHANTVRIQVTKILLDPKGPVYNATYFSDVINAVTLIRSLGLIAQISLQYEDEALMCNIPNDYDNQPGNPIVWGDQIIRCWEGLLTPFANDTGVLAEILNEPAIGGNCQKSSSFESWNKAFQPIVNSIRSSGAKNILIIPSPYQEHYADTTSVSGGSSIAQYPVIDPLQSIVFGMHPTPVIHGEQLPCIISYLSQNDWDKWWGNLEVKINQSIVVTEWFTGSKAACWDNKTVLYPVPEGYNSTSTFSSPILAQNFLDWIGKMKSSISGIFHFDDLGYIIQDWTGVPTNFGQNGTFSCQQQDLGPGEMIIDFFSQN